MAFLWDGRVAVEGRQVQGALAALGSGRERQGGGARVEGRVDVGTLDGGPAVNGAAAKPVRGALGGHGRAVVDRTAARACRSGLLLLLRVMVVVVMVAVVRVIAGGENTILIFLQAQARNVQEDETKHEILADGSRSVTLRALGVVFDAQVLVAGA